MHRRLGRLEAASFELFWGGIVYHSRTLAKLSVHTTPIMGVVKEMKFNTSRGPTTHEIFYMHGH